MKGLKNETWPNLEKQARGAAILAIVSITMRGVSLPHEVLETTIIPLVGHSLVTHGWSRNGFLPLRKCIKLAFLLFLILGVEFCQSYLD